MGLLALTPIRTLCLPSVAVRMLRPQPQAGLKHVQQQAAQRCTAGDGQACRLEEVDGNWQGPQRALQAGHQDLGEAPHHDEQPLQWRRPTIACLTRLWHHAAAAGPRLCSRLVHWMASSIRNTGSEPPPVSCFAVMVAASGRHTDVEGGKWFYILLVL